MKNIIFILLIKKELEDLEKKTSYKKRKPQQYYVIKNPFALLTITRSLLHDIMTIRFLSPPSHMQHHFSPPPHTTPPSSSPTFTSNFTASHHHQISSPSYLSKSRIIIIDHHSINGSHHLVAKVVLS